jgi:hypothetical protein
VLVALASRSFFPPFFRMENMQINQLQILRISNLKFGPAIMSGA